MFMKAAIILLTFLVAACEPFYDPVEENDIPSSTGTAWKAKPFTVKKTAELPYSLADISANMSLTLLLDIALYNNPETRASWNAAKAAAYGYRTSLAPYYPTIDYIGTLNAQTNKGSVVAFSGEGIVATPVTTIAETRRTFLTNEVTLAYLLLDFGGRDANAELALQTLYETNWTHDLTMQEVMLSVLTAYISFLGNKELVESYKQDLHDAEVALSATQVMKSAGLATLTDVLFSQSTVESTRASLLQAMGSEKTSIGQLLIAVGLPPDSKITVDQLPHDLPYIQISGDISDLLEEAKKNRPDLGAAIAVIKQQEAELAISYSSGMPTITGNASWYQTRFISPRQPSGYNQVASFELNFPIFEGFYYMNQQRQLRAEIQEALANLDVQLANVYTQVVTNYYSFKAAEEALPSAEAAVQYSMRAFRGYVVQYKTGTATILDVLTSLTALSNARYQLVLTRTQWASGLANLAFSVGVLEDVSGRWIKSPPKKFSELLIEGDDKGKLEAAGIGPKTAPKELLESIDSPIEPIELPCPCPEE
jgi:outer membrane protein